MEPILKPGKRKGIPLPPFRIERVTPEKTTLIDRSDNLEDALILASVYCETTPEKELRILDASGETII